MALQLKGLTTVFFIFYGTSEAQQLCHYGQWTSNTVKLNMDTTPILGENGMCSCYIAVNSNARVTVFPGPITVQNCDTNIELVDSGFTFNCVNGKIPVSPSYAKQHSTGEVLWLRVTTTVSSDQSLSGSIQIKTQQVSGGVSDPKMTVECYEPHSNSILTTTTTTTTTTSKPTTTTTTTTTSKPTTTTTTTTSKPTTTTTMTPPPTTTSKPATTTKPKAQVTTTGPHKTIQTDTASAAEVTSPSNPSTTGQLSEVTTEMKTTTQSQSSPPLSSDSGVDGGTGQTSQTTTPVGGMSSGETDKNFPDGNSYRPTNANLSIGGVVGVFVAGIAVTVIIISGFFLVRRCRKPPHTVDKDIPMSETHPTYSGLTGVDKTVYDHITAKHTDYNNMATTSDYQNP